MEPTAFPLTWPAAIPRTKNREKSRFMSGSITPEEEHTFHRLKDLLRWRDARKETPEDEQKIVCCEVDNTRYTLVGCFLADIHDLDLCHPNPDPEGDQIIPFTSITAWRVFVPGIDTPPET